jgi:O-antigen biosynthesis protein WbqP
MIRTLDILLSVIGLVLLFPLMIILYAIVWYETRAPIFGQPRLGIQQKTFILVKFRTMRVGTPSVASHLADERAITVSGRFLRKTKLDELPQLWNVLRGEMSFVGPRPCLENQEELIAARVRLNAFCVRPGVTGFAQLRGIDMATPQVLADIDAQLVQSLSLSTYLRCIIFTMVGRGYGDRVPRNLAR